MMQLPSCLQSTDEIDNVLPERKKDKLKTLGLLNNCLAELVMRFYRQLLGIYQD